jgi:VWFA-related protein
MFQLLHKRVLAALLLLALPATYTIAQTPPADTSGGIQIEFPAGGQLRIENELGEVSAETWNEKYISVATTEGGAAAKGSSVVIENRGQGLIIRVVRRKAVPLTSVVPINLAILIPESARVEVITRSGPASLRGMPASATINSVSGDVKVELPANANVDLVARATRGLVKSDLPRLAGANTHVLQARLGTGRQPLKLNTDTGNITLVPGQDSRAIVKNNVEGPRPPAPLQVEVGTKAAGTPAPPLDAQEIGEGDVIRVDSQLVTLNVSVIDRNTNRGLLGLTKSDFKLFENGAEQQILQFDSSSAPFDLLLVIDLSGSTREVVKLIRAAALRFVQAARPSDRIGVITFAAQPALVSPLTEDRQLLRERITEMNTLGGDTKLYDAADFALSQTLNNSKNPRRTAVIVMSDGLDGNIPGVQGEGSRLPYTDLLNRVREFDGVLYTLWLNTEYEALSPLDTQPEAFDAGYDRMKELADTGGGVFYEVERLDDLAGAYERVVADLGTVYSLAYRPTDKSRNGKWRAIRVNIARPAAVARGKHGYYAN